MANERLRLLFCDHLNLARGKYLPKDKMKDGHTRMSQALYGVTYDKDLIPAPGSRMLEGAPDMMIAYKEADIRPGWDDGVKIVAGEARESDGSPMPCCGRQALKRAVKDWQALGYTPKLGLEIECFAFERDADGRLKPYDTPGAYVYSTGRFADPRGFTDALWAKAEAAGFRLDSATTEYDAPQFEFTLTFDDAVKAVDDHFLFRLMAREIAHDHGLVLTCLPKPFANKGGSGQHVNFSFFDKTGKNAVGDPGPAETMTALARGAIAGLMRHHKGLAGLVAPCVNSYERLRPASMSGYWRNWGGDHRGVTTRVPPEGGEKARIEHRMADGAANPYVMTAAVLQAARLGFVGGYGLPPAETGDCFERSDAAEGTAETLAAALDDLEADAALMSAVGETLCANHIFIKRNEAEKAANLEGDAKRDFYIHFF